MATTGHSHHPSTDALGPLLCELREGKGLSLTELAERTGLSRQCIKNTEKGKSRPRHETVMRLCDALEISWDEFHRRLRAAASGDAAADER